MKNSKSKPVAEGGKKIKLQVDRRTIIILRTKKALTTWMRRYPKAKVLAA